MKHFVKHKFYGKLLSSLKFKRHKKIRTFISFSKKKLDYNAGISFDYKKLDASLKRVDPFYNLVPNSSLTSTIKKKESFNDSDFFFKLKQQNKKSQNDIADKKTNLFDNKQQLIKKKYKINSFLFNMLCQYSRGRIKTTLGKEFFSRYYTVPYRLSLSRFISNKVLRSFYQNLSKKNLRNLRKKITLKAKRSNGPINSNFENNKINSVQKSWNKKELNKNIIFNLENRLDYSLLRLFQFKSLFTKKYNNFDNNLDLASKKRPLRNLRSWKVKSPWKNFSSLQIKQKIKHGHILINNKKVKSSNIQLKLSDRIAIKGYIQNPLWEQKQNTLFKQTSHLSDFKNTFFFRNKDHFLSDVLTLHEKKPLINQENFLLWKEEKDKFDFQNIWTNTENKEENIKLLCNYINHLKIKRFSEIFYLTYKNFFLLPECSIFHKPSFSPNESERTNNLNFIFKTVGFNQSIYLLWPLFYLLTVQSWNSDIKNNVLRSYRINISNLNKKTKYSLNKGKNNLSSVSTKNMKNLINLKNYQNKLFQLESKKNELKNSQNILNHFTRDNNYPSWVLKKSLNCYASFVYGTRKCKWVQLQQQKKTFFYNKIYNKINFFELELDFFQLIYSHYKNK